MDDHRLLCGKGDKNEKDLSSWDFVRCPPAVAVQKFTGKRGSSLSVVMGINEHDLNFIVGRDLGKAVYSEWLKYVMSEEEWSRMFGNSQIVNAERAGMQLRYALPFSTSLHCAQVNSGFGVILVRTTLVWNIL